MADAPEFVTVEMRLAFQRLKTEVWEDVSKAKHVVVAARHARERLQEKVQRLDAMAKWLLAQPDADRLDYEGFLNETRKHMRRELDGIRDDS